MLEEESVHESLIEFSQFLLIENDLRPTAHASGTDKADRKKDRGKDVESAPWYGLGPEYDEKEGSRINDHHLTLKEKKDARAE